VNDQLDKQLCEKFAELIIDSCAEAAEEYWNDASLQRAFSISEYLKSRDKMNEEHAILYVMEFYRVSREVACEYYWDEIEAYMKFLGDSKTSNYLAMEGVT
jgi:hypothetical protein